MNVYQLHKQLFDLHFNLINGNPLAAGIHCPEKNMNPNSSQIDRLRHFNKRATNRLTMRFAGKHVYAVIHHQGRKSGKAYQTPVVAMPTGDGFIFPLPYSEHADWCRNVLAAGGCRIEWRGRWYTLENPQLTQRSESIVFFPCWMHRLLRRTEVYLKLDKAPRQELPPGRAIRKILVYGAGVLGSLYAGKLHQAGYSVTLLTREERLESLRRDGLVLVADGAQGAPAREEHISLPVICKLVPDDAYDLVLVVVRKNQISSVLPALAANTGTPNVLFLVNNAEGAGPLVSALGHERVVLGFPGAGGRRVDNRVNYYLASGVQPTTIGELDGQHTARLEQIAQAFQDAGLPVATCDNMDAWLKTHVALVSPIANAIYLAGGSNYRLARTRDGVVLMVRAIKEGLRVLRALNIPLTPARFRMLEWLPEPLLVALLQRRLGSAQVELALAGHANAARDEMTALANEFRVLVHASGLRTPALDALYCYVNPDNPPIPEGQANIQLTWGPTIAAAGALVSAGVLATWLLWKGKKKVK